ncbi:CBS domain-containing protein [Streptomyces sp. NPDC101132]|uniref:CBS domain-containing protein n=1 Tax=Streptomyces sp. NPDC101132 TaxID=3366110 RepID=UPI003827B006
MTTTRHTVSDVMTHTAVAIGQEASYKEIVALMHEWKVSALPVLAGEGRVVGVVSEADLLPKEEFRGTEPVLPDELAEAAKAGALLAGDLMSSPAVTVHPAAPVAEAARIMARKHVKRLPVVNELGLLEGVVSRSDLLKVFLRSDAELAEEVRTAVVAELAPGAGVEVAVREGVVTLRGGRGDSALLGLLARAVRAVEGVVDVGVSAGPVPPGAPV